MQERDYLEKLAGLANWVGAAGENRAEDVKVRAHNIRHKGFLRGGWHNLKKDVHDTGRALTGDLPFFTLTGRAHDKWAQHHADELARLRAETARNKKHRS